MPQTLTPAISRDTLEIARTAIRHLASGVKHWADMPNEERAKRIYSQMVQADQELSDAIAGEG